MERPSPISKDDPTDCFDSGSPDLDRWLVTLALRNELSGASRTYVIREAGRIVAFYSLANGSVQKSGAPGAIRRNMPDPIPVMILARLAVARTHQGQGLGRSLVREALLRTLQASENAGIRAMMVHALDEQAAAFYERLGFTPSPIDQLVYFARMDFALASIGTACLAFADTQ